ncbi:hypothetical protein [Brevundimonas goettingensis]|uniref:Uncharacterized protein n=1 Tax=Brevundimonas goettingensis TaxID=2774190 RepID=A0A975C3W5_9CAUL|nr:hypothetical protein [Brevundimonas goettingensis]QTC92990.1 hypothetical protein IFJ75_09180 [Brevundimonas goettingensis]
MAKLKVFTWADGFHAFTVAASSRPKALAAWGIERDIFKDGLASEITSGPDHDAALEAPGEVIQRGLAIDVGKISKAAKPLTKPVSSKAREAVKALEADLEILDRDQTAEVAALDQRRAALDAEAKALAASQDNVRKALLAKLKAARAKL